MRAQDQLTRIRETINHVNYVMDNLMSKYFLEDKYPPRDPKSSIACISQVLRAPPLWSLLLEEEKLPKKGKGINNMALGWR